MDKHKIIDAYEKVRSAADDDDHAHAEYTDDGYWVSVNRYGKMLQIIASKGGNIDGEVSGSLRSIVDEHIDRTGRGLSRVAPQVTPDRPFITWFEGVCPQCRLEQREMKMVINRSDFFECPDCHLQVCGISRLHMIIMHMRGNGDLKPDSPATVDSIENPRERILCEEGHNNEGKYYYPFQPGEMIVTQEHLRQYLATVR